MANEIPSPARPQAKVFSLFRTREQVADQILREIASMNSELEAVFAGLEAEFSEEERSTGACVTVEKIFDSQRRRARRLRQLAAVYFDLPPDPAG